DHGMDDLPSHPIMRRWWTHMAPLMDVNPDDSPVVLPLRRVFHMP
ncbi:MAG: L-rhamnose mutarotase, partial [Pseudomonadota bacterium]